ncbi:proline-rich protein [Aspergillus costaricaensis CBS 115574]|uniref:Proline-rich protein n=1 Tax=Aspergillus costaricaensis CBS 115574 TaxID=1448317 RepID=A0ACD1I3M9_9EURO|nr:proline-rich protein [Aspergillus costaricaensis CBS 115574]RAK84378.1 proline-rich protein [Aspergillus costaricaensis CBS 115574]
MSQFQLFPSPSDSRPSKELPRVPKKPAIKTHTEMRPMEEIRDKSSPTEAVIFKLIQDTHTSIRPPPKAMSRSNPISIPDTIRERETSKSLHDRHKRPAERVGSPSHSVRSASLQSSLPAAAPVVPMKSTFPRYNYDLPTNQQQYYPEPSFNSHWELSRSETETPPPEIDRALGPRTVPASVLNFPAGVLDPVERYSTQEELQSLWEIANGQRPRSLPGTFNLCVDRIDANTLTFGDPKSPFYTLRATSAKDISIIRKHPSKHDSSVPVMNLKLEDKSRRQSPCDGLVSILFPRLAAILAIDQAAEVAEELRLSPLEATKAEVEALKRVAAQESCKLLWNQSKRVYELHHPALCKQQPPALVGAAGIPLSPVRSKYSGVLHITVSSLPKEGGCSQPPTILITTPLPANAVETGAMAATPRTSTLPLTDADEPLASLDLRTMTLSLATGSIVATIPSLYAVDCLISALLTVALSDESTRPVLEGLKLYDQGLSTPPFSNSREEMITALAEQEDAKEGSQLWSKVKSQPKSDDRREYHFWKREPKKPKTQKVIIEEFDMDKYGRYQGGSREGEELPRITRGCLRVLFWGFNVVVHGLTMVVKGIAWMVVNLTRCCATDSHIS